MPKGFSNKIGSTGIQGKRFYFSIVFKKKKKILKESPLFPHVRHQSQMQPFVIEASFKCHMTHFDFLFDLDILKIHEVCIVL